MKLSEQDKEDITDMVIESRDVEEDLTTVYLKGYADAEEKYRKKIKELEEENATLRRVNKITKDINIEEVAKEIDKNYKEFLKEFIPTQKVKDMAEKLKCKAKRIAGTYQYADSGDDLKEKKSKVIELRTKAEALEELLEDK